MGLRTIFLNFKKFLLIRGNSPYVFFNLSIINSSNIAVMRTSDDKLQVSLNSR